MQHSSPGTLKKRAHACIYLDHIFGLLNLFRVVTDLTDDTFKQV